MTPSGIGTNCEREAKSANCLGNCPGNVRGGNIRGKLFFGFLMGDVGEFLDFRTGLQVSTYSGYDLGHPV